MKSVVYDSITDVYDELERVYDEAVDGNFKKGKSLYEQHFFFCNPQLLYSHKYQAQIKMVEYAKLTSTPPYPTMYDTPIQFVDEFFIIQKELKDIIDGK